MVKVQILVEGNPRTVIIDTIDEAIRCAFDFGYRQAIFAKSDEDFCSYEDAIEEIINGYYDGKLEDS